MTNAFINVTDYGAVGNGTTDDRAAIASADAVSSTTIFPEGSYRIASNITLSSAVFFVKGAIIKPDSGVTVAFVGPVTAEAFQIVDISAGGHCDFTMSRPTGGISPVEWWGVQVSSAFSSSLAAANKPLIDEALTYGATDIAFQGSGVYSTTGHILDGSRPRNIIGRGQSDVFYIQGSGIPYAYAGEVSASDPVAAKDWVFQNGISGTGSPNNFIDLSIQTTDQTAVGGIIIGDSSSQIMNWLYGGQNCIINHSYVALHIEWANANLWSLMTLQGYYAGLGLVVPNIKKSSDGLSVSKLHFNSCQISNSQTSAHQIIWEADPGSTEALKAHIYTNCSIEQGYNGIVRAASGVIYNACYIERVQNTVGLISGESVAVDSVWINPKLGGPNSVADLLAQRGPRTIVISTGNFFGSQTGTIEALGGIQFADPGDSISKYESKRPFTPVLQGSSTVGTPTYSLCKGFYTRIGSLIRCHIEVAITSVGGMSGILQISGLPYSCSATANLRSASSKILFDGITMAVNYTDVVGFLATNSDAISFYQTGSGQTDTPLLISGGGSISSSLWLGFDIIYDTDDN